MALFTKSRFKLALSCPTKLYYSTSGNNYKDTSADDEFLKALAEGGYQVGELAKYLFTQDPIAENISIDVLGYDESLAATAIKRAAGGRVVIAEPAFRYNDLFVRVDVLVEENNCIDIYEVKAKSWSPSDVFLKAARKKVDQGKYTISSKWSPYLYDIAFQKYVVQQANPTKKVRAHIVLANKTSTVTIDGLNQLFKIKRNGTRVQIEVQPGVTQQSLGTIPLKTINVDDVCEWIFQNPVAIDLPGVWMFEPLVNYLSEKFIANEKIWSSCLGSKCKKCPYINKEYPNGAGSGFHECWQQLARLSSTEVTQPLITELWCGNGPKTILKEAISQERYLLRYVDETLYPRGENPPPYGDTLDGCERRNVQIEKSSNQNFTPYIDIPGLTDLFNTLPAPYHFIDFETTMVALPFHAGRQPYEAIAFQYSYHLMDAQGNIEHKNQYLNFEQNEFPNYDFVRHLQADLSGKPGTIFRYHQHENTYLNHIYKQLISETASTVPDKESLMEFIREISRPTTDNPDTWEPSNNMVDLYDLVLDHFYSLYAKGSNSIKDILPAVIKSSAYLRTKYNEPVYATAAIPSLNFTTPHTWIQASKGLNPYKTLPNIFDGVDIEEMAEMEGFLSELDNGGSAMMAYAYLQFTDMTNTQRAYYKNGLLRYCELDTMAMVMIWEYWGSEVGRW